MAGMDRTEWRNLLAYYRRCIAGETAGEVHGMAQSGRRFAIPDSGYALGLDTWTLSECERFATLIDTAEKERKALYLGYPAVVVERPADPSLRRAAERLVAPLLTVQLQMPPAGVARPDRLVAADELPQAHFGLLKALGVEDEDLDRVGAALPFDALLEAPLHTAASALRELLGVDVAPPGAPLTHPGVHERAVVYMGASQDAIRGLLEELRLLQDRWEDARHTALSWLMGDVPPEVPPGTRIPPLLTPWTLNAAQQEALQSILTAPLTMVTGPPGTGKSQLIANLVASCWAAQRTVCVASTNNQAVDVVARRLGDLAAALIVRSGNRDIRTGAEKAVERLCESTIAGRPVDAVRSDVAGSWAQVEYAQGEMARRQALDAEMPALLDSRIALARHLSIDTVVLEAMSALRVREHLATGERLRTARLLGGWRRRRFLRGMGVAALDDAFERTVDLLRCEARRRAILDDPAPPHGVAVERYRAARQQHRDRSVGLSKELVASGLHAHRARIAASSRAIALPRLAQGATFRQLLSALPAWAATSHSAAGSFPLTPGLFDVLVVDEASQCSIPAIIPLLFRARSVAIVGDPRQLTHVTRVDERTNRRFLRASGLGEEWPRGAVLDYRRSVFQALDAVAGRRVLLDEHYRCHPAIAEAANAIFYDGRLTVLTDPSRFQAGEPLAWIDVHGEVCRGPAGSSAVNDSEAERVVERLVELVASGTTSVGVVSPFRAQAELILRRALWAHGPVLAAALGPLRESIGTAHTFQGSERDVILFSPVVSQGAPDSVRRFLERTPNLVNVALTRARQRFLVIGDAQACTGASEAMRLLHREVVRIGSEAATDRADRRGQLDSDAERVLYGQLTAAGLDVVPKLRWHHIEMDFAVREGRLLLDVECDGDHHHTPSGSLRPADLSRDDLLEANGIGVLRVADWRCRQEPEQVVAEVRAALQRRHAGSAM